MAFPPPVLPVNRTNATPQVDIHPADHNAISQAINDLTAKVQAIDNTRPRGYVYSADISTADVGGSKTLLAYTLPAASWRANHVILVTGRWETKVITNTVGSVSVSLLLAGVTQAMVRPENVTLDVGDFFYPHVQFMFRASGAAQALAFTCGLTGAGSLRPTRGKFMVQDLGTGG